MTTPDDTLQQFILREIRLLLVPLAGTIDGGETGRLLADAAGWRFEAGVDPATDDRIVQFATAYRALDGLLEDPPRTLAEVIASLEGLDGLWALVRQVPVEPRPGGESAGVLGRNLVEALVLDHLRTWHPLVNDVLALLTVVRPTELSLDRVTDLFTDPIPLLRDEYLGPGGLVSVDDAGVAADRLLPRLATLLRHLGLHADIGTEPPSGPLPSEAAARIAGRMLSVHLQPDLEDPDRYGVTLALSPQDLGGPALVVVPWGQVSPYWDADVNLRPAAGGFAVGPAGVTLLGTSAALNNGFVVAQLPAQVIGAAEGTRLELGAMTISAALVLDVDDPEYGVAVDLATSTLVISAGDGDGLLASILPADGLQTRFDLGIGWSNKEGLHLRGSAGLEVSLPGASIGGALSVPSVDVRLRAVDDRLVAQVSAAVTVFIGPVRATVAGLGFAAELTFPNEGGNLGAADLELGLTPPTGVGLAVNAPVVRGGGFLGHEPELDRYSGALHVTIGTVDLAAWGVLQPGSSTRHWSLAVFLAGRIPPVELGWNFRLTALGGVLALHRRMDTDALRDAASGVGGSLDDLLFPESPETRLPQLLSTMERFFPPAAGSHVAGPMVEIDWGRGNQVNARIRAVLLLQLDDGKVGLYGTVRIGFPRIDADSTLRVRAALEALVDPRQTMARFSITIIEAKLFDSIRFTGGAAFFVRWGAGRTFAFTAGGFHPSYRPFIPSGLTEPPRIGVHWNPVNGVRLDLTQYFAMTSTSMQFGAAAHAEVGCSWGKVTGDLSFDFLVMTSPSLHMEAQLHARVTVNVFGADLLSAGLDGALSGPNPWVFSGKVSWSVWIFDISKSFSFEWGDPADVPATPQSAGQLLADELQVPGNWTSMRTRQPPVRVRSGVSAPLAPTDQIEVRQSRLPFGTRVETYEGNPLTDAGVWQLTASSSSGIVTLGDVIEVFPERRFLSRPSRDRPFRGGLSCGARLARTDWDVPTSAVAVDSTATDDVVIDGGVAVAGPVRLPAPSLAEAVGRALPTTSAVRVFTRGAVRLEAVS